jgi:hypothetical protein
MAELVLFSRFVQAGLAGRPVGFLRDARRGLGEKCVAISAARVRDFGATFIVRAGKLSIIRNIRYIVDFAEQMPQQSRYIVADEVLHRLRTCCAKITIIGKSPLLFSPIIVANLTHSGVYEDIAILSTFDSLREFNPLCASSTAARADKMSAFPGLVRIRLRAGHDCCCLEELALVLGTWTFCPLLRRGVPVHAATISP